MPPGHPGENPGSYALGGEAGTQMAMAEGPARQQLYGMAPAEVAPEPDMTIRRVVTEVELSSHGCPR